MTTDDQYQKSRKLTDQAMRHDAWMKAELTSPSRQNYQFINGQYPYLGDRASGAYLWDVDGNRYIDYNMGYGTVILGHTHPEITEAVIAELRKGHHLSPLWKPAQAELCELICETIPGCEQAFLMKTGSDATSGAIRLARLYTGRDRVLRCGYNGWHDWCTPRPGGVPYIVRELIHPFPYNDLEAAEQLFRTYPNEIACIFMMPFELDEPEPGYLEALKALAHQNGALFMFDEMRSGFRFALGGAQEYLGITADLATYSKAMGNGYAVSALAGRADILAGLSETKMTATYFSSTDTMVAALTCIEVMKRERIHDQIWGLGYQLETGLQDIAANSDNLFRYRGFAVMPYLEIVEPDLQAADRIKVTFFAELARKGILMHPSHHWYVSGAHTPEDIRETLIACETAMEAALKSL